MHHLGLSADERLSCTSGGTLAQFRESFGAATAITAGALQLPYSEANSERKDDLVRQNRIGVLKSAPLQVLYAVPSLLLVNKQHITPEPTMDATLHVLERATSLLRLFTSLPVELRQRILESAAASEGGVDKRARTTLMLCCKQWCALVRESPILWSHVQFHSDAHHPAVKSGLQRSIQLAGELPRILNVSLRPVLWFFAGEENALDVIGQDTIDMLHKLVQYARHLDLKLPTQYFPLPVPTLSPVESVTIEIFNLTSMLPAHLKAPQVFTCTGEVRPLAVKGLVTVTSPRSLSPQSFTGIRVTNLELFIKVGDMSDLLALLKSLPLLERLAITVQRILPSSKQGEHNTQSAVFSLPLLKILEVYDKAADLFTQCFLPLLTHTRIPAYFHPSFDEVLLRVLQTSPVEHLSLDDIMPFPSMPLHHCHTLQQISVLDMKLPFEDDEAAHLRHLLNNPRIAVIRISSESAYSIPMGESHQHDIADIRIGRDSYYKLLEGFDPNPAVRSRIIFSLAENECNCTLWALYKMLLGAPFFAGRVGWQPHNGSTWDSWQTPNLLPTLPSF